MPFDEGHEVLISKTCGKAYNRISAPANASNSHMIVAEGKYGEQNRNRDMTLTRNKPIATPVQSPGRPSIERSLVG